MDDCLTNFGNVQKAVELVRDVDQLLTRGGFWLMKSSSNELGALEGIESEKLAPDIADIEF